QLSPQAGVWPRCECCSGNSEKLKFIIMNRKTPLLIAVLASAAVSAHAQNLLTNPGFETGDFTGWTLSGDTSFCSVSTQHPHSGSFSARLAGLPGTGFLDQTITTVVGQSYHVDFWLALI